MSKITTIQMLQFWAVACSRR